jgi:hypothetical protein
MSKGKKERDEWWESHYEALSNSAKSREDNIGRGEVHSETTDKPRTNSHWNKFEYNYGQTTTNADPTKSSITWNKYVSVPYSTKDIEDFLREWNEPPTMRDHAYDIVDEAVELLIKKHEDYGPLNIANAPGGALNGLAVRLHDKVSRLGNLAKTENEPNYESIRDTFIDIINYAVIGILVSEDHWE